MPAPEFTLYGHFESGNVYKAALLLALAGQAYDYRHVDIFAGATKDDGFTAMNTFQEVPVLLHDGNTLTQSDVILRYLADFTGRFGGRDEAERRRIQEWMAWTSNKLTNGISQARFGLRWADYDLAVITFFQDRANAAFELVAEFDAPAIAIIKHANPCGVAIGKTPFEAYKKALACDPVSAFGGIIALNRALDGETAKAIAELFVEVVIAPEISAPARAALAGKKNVRLLETGAMPDPTSPGMTVKSLAGGYLFQSRDQGCIKQADLKTVTKRPPSKSELADLLFAFSVCKHVKSNAIVYAKDGATVGIGAGQMSRIDSARIAAIKSDEAAQAAGETESRTKGCVVASDAFFPFADGLLAAASAGAIAVIQPGGSMRDDEVIKAADEKGLAMVMTGMRHFRH